MLISYFWFGERLGFWLRELVFWIKEGLVFWVCGEVSILGFLEGFIVMLICYFLVWGLFSFFGFGIV